MYIERAPLTFIEIVSIGRLWSSELLDSRGSILDEVRYVHKFRILCGYLTLPESCGRGWVAEDMCFISLFQDWGNSNLNCSLLAEESMHLEMQ